MDLNQVTNYLNSLDQCTLDGDQFSRIRALEAAKRLQTRLEMPWEGLARMGWFEIPRLAALKVAIDLQVFPVLKQGPKQLSEIANIVKCEENLLRRHLRLLATYEFLVESAEEVYSLNRLSSTYATDPSMPAAMNYIFDILLPSQLKMPEVLAANNYKNPMNHEIWKSVTGENKSFYEWLPEHPAKAANFQQIWTGYSSDRPTWTSFYPTNQLIDTWQEGTPLIVDVGGGMGQDLVSFLRLHKDAIKGELILQDLAPTIEMAKKTLDPSITATVHDFFTPQPVRGARVYHVHSVLFNWPDVDAVKILRSLKPALEPGYSRILINEMVCVPGNSAKSAAALDLVMMGVFSAKVRTKSEWENLVTDAGLAVVKFWTVPEVYENIIEVALP